MKRRTFVRGLAAAATVPWLPPAGEILEDLTRDLARAPDEQAFWRSVRSRFLLRPGLSHMNSATIGATPRPVVSAFVGHLWETEGDPQDQVFGAPHLRMEEVRAHAAAFLGASADEVVLTRNTTEGMNAVAQGMDLGPGDQILTTNHEHPGGSLCWEHVARRTGAEIVKIEMPAPVRTADQVVALVQAHLTSRTRVCSFSHVCTVTGLVMPLAAIAALTRPRGILLVCDGAQAPGQLDVDVGALGVDTYASSSHKWLLAPKGTGLLYIRDEVRDRVRPMSLDAGYGAYTGSFGTRNVAIVLAHGAALDFHDAIGRDRVEARCRELRRRLRAGLERMPGLRILTPDQEALCAGIVTVSLESGDYREVRRVLHDDHDIVLKNGKPEYNALRISTHIFNSEADVDRLLAALPEAMTAR
ncbi:MAG TPA: aminotransferase class V-fold PLP-dependent enzyme [Longimicrobiales bacterium]|nr:aminotransferase class V-fold PLP-dependent enzyme [Longimicrobiales bacterium]